MKLNNITTVGITLFPALVSIPIFVNLALDVHPDGINTLLNFFLASIRPSLNPIVLESAWDGLKITIATSLISWFFSISIGSILGILSSSIFWKILGKKDTLGILIKRSLIIPRSIHEIVWGLLLLQIFSLNPFIAIIAIVIPYSSITARVIANQLDTFDYKYIILLNQTGSSFLSNFSTNLIRPVLSILRTYGIYRLECTFRASILAGMFGLGGIGTELQLTTQSLRFEELWTSLWILGLLIFLLERISNSIGSKSRFISFNPNNKLFINTLIILLLISISILSFESFKISFNSAINFHPIDLPNLIDIKNAFNELPIFNLITSTIFLTFLSACFAIGLPPLTLSFFRNPNWLNIQSIIWMFFRLIPPPLTAFLLLLSNKPSVYLAAMALGIYNLGVLGRLLKENTNKNKNSNFDAIKRTGASNQISWIYGYLSAESKKYLAFSAYRADVILRETALVGVVGGVGLGWQLQESLSSFNWAQVSVITLLFAILTLTGEYISDKTQRYWLSSTSSYLEIISLKS